MRAFVAIDVAEQVLDSLATFQGELSATGADLKLVERENLHFTIKFLGEITEGALGEAASRLSRLSLRGGAVEVRGAGAFPSLGRPRVVWAGVAAEHVQALVQLAGEVARALEGVGERDDRPFQSHVTLGRVRSPRSSRELTEVLRSGSARSFGTAELSELKLKSSSLTPAGPIYKDLKVFALR